MNFGNNLQAIRKKHNLSQEELAFKLDISRQAISKWEGGTGFPEMEKLIQISELFHYSIDELLKEKIDMEHQLINQNLKEETTREFKKFGIAITVAVMMLIFGCSLFLFFPWLEELIVIVFFLLVTIAVAIFIYAGTTHDHFTRTHDVKNLYSKEEQDEYQKNFSIGIVIGVTTILLGIIVFLSLEYLLPNTEFYENLGSGVFLCMVACSMPFFIYNGIIQSKFEEEEKVQNTKENVIIGKLCGVIMLCATLVYLYFGFTKNEWGTMWYVFPLGGILCGIVGTIFGKTD